MLATWHIAEQRRWWMIRRQVRLSVRRCHVDILEPQSPSLRLKDEHEMQMNADQCISMRLRPIYLPFSITYHWWFTLSSSKAQGIHIDLFYDYALWCYGALWCFHLIGHPCLDVLSLRNQTQRHSATYVQKKCRIFPRSGLTRAPRYLPNNQIQIEIY